MSCAKYADCRVWNPITEREYRVGHKEIRGGDFAPENRGMIELQSDLRPLLTAQKRSYMLPRYQNSGCISPYCSNAGQCPGGERTGDKFETKNLPKLFYTTDPAESQYAENGPTPIALSTLGQKVSYSTANWYNLTSLQAPPYAQCDGITSDGCSNRWLGINSLPNNQTCGCQSSP
jgi:hypothetical protein